MANYFSGRRCNVPVYLFTVLCFLILHHNTRCPTDTTRTDVSRRDEPRIDNAVGQSLIKTPSSFSTNTTSQGYQYKRHPQITNAIRSCKRCVFHDLTAELTADPGLITCVVLRSVPPSTVCVYPPERDAYISKSLLDSGMYEGSFVKRMQDFIRADPDVHLVDIGCNIGVYTMAIAKMGRQVVAVDPVTDNVVRVHKAAKTEGVGSQIVLLQNAVSNKLERVGLQLMRKSPGNTFVKAFNSSTDSFSVETITLNDVSSFCTFKKAVLKIDVEGSEHKAFQNATTLFDKVDIPVIMMEWAAMARKGQRKPGDEDLKMVNNMINFFYSRTYTPVSWNGRVLERSQWASWPWEIFWLKPDVKF